MANPDTAAPATSPARPKRQTGLLSGLGFVYLAVMATYAALAVSLVPNQVQAIDAADKVGNLAIVNTIAAVVTIFFQPIAGALSDRTRSRFGRRAPWMVLGAVIAALFLLGLGASSSIPFIAIFLVLAQAGLNTVNGPASAIVADRFDRSRRGIASAVTGVGTMIGFGVGVGIAGALANDLGLGYLVFGVLVLVAVLVFVLTNPDAPSTDLEKPAFRWGRFVRGFWVNPRKNPDFAWAFGARFAMILAYQSVQSYLLYILRDHIHVSDAASNGLATLITAAMLGSALVTTFLGGVLSDKVGRRKPFVIVASLFMAVALVFPVISPTVGAMFALAVVFGVGYGAYLSVDLALMTEVLPDAGRSAARDMGILNVATNVPQALTPVVAWLLITYIGGYTALFIAGIVFCVVGALTILPIKSVR